MSESYHPGPDAFPEQPYDVVFQSQRDLGLTVPINFVTVPGVSFSAACFPTLNFEDDNSGDCFSNLLAMGFRRFEIDLYWDDGRGLWSFCPVAIPSDITSLSEGAETVILSGSGITNSTQSSTSATSTTTPSLPLVRARQTTSAFLSSVVLSGTNLDSSSTTTTAADIASSIAAASSLGPNPPNSSSIPSSNNYPLIEIGPYICTTTINLSTFTSQLFSYIQTTQDNVQAQIMYVIINLHAAKSDTAPDSPAPLPSTLPSGQNLISAQFTANLSSYLYTPTKLRTDRANLNESWYSVPEVYRPATGYYETNFTERVVSSEDGWPTSYAVEFKKGGRLLLGWGTVDPQMSGYNFTGDEAVLFESGYIQSLQPNITSTSSGNLIRGCFLETKTDDRSLSRINSSWASDANLPGFDYPVSNTSAIGPFLNLTTNTTGCGITQILNVTLQNTTAHDNPTPYKNYVYATVWSWAPGEPKNFSSSTSSSLFHCATSSIGLSGRWAVSDCSQKYYSACRATSASASPYNWTITSYPVSYSYASQSCPDGYDFGAPRTALENSYLTQAMKDSNRDYDGHGVWIDLNDLDYKSCWVSGGPNATCPYKAAFDQADDLRHKTVLVPALAALIVLIITSLTVLVKFAGNRSTRRHTQKRANNGFIYEGVPS